jgi:tRNA A37 methylthiotransferase MiaB
VDSSDVLLSGRINEELIQTIKKNDKICKYIDMPIQHASDSVFEKNGKKKQTKNKL